MAGGRPGRPPGRPRGSGGRPRGTGRRPGRPRRDSDSTVASVDLSNIEYVPELSILKPAPSSTDFPTFVLDDAVIYRKGPDGNLVVANVCNVNLDGPLIVRGKLEVENEHRPFLRKPSRNTARIEVPACWGYSIGYGPWPAVWACGEAGWYEINPSKEYRDMHDYMCEGITLYYKVMDAYVSLSETAPKGKKYRAWQTPIEKVLLKYSVAIGDGATLVDVQNRCQKHAPFLLAHFEQESDFNWKPTSFRKWLLATNEELVKRLKAAPKKGPAAASAPMEIPAADATNSKDESNDSSAHDSPLNMTVVTDRSKRSKSRTQRQSTDNDAPMEDPPPRRSETYIPPPVIPRPRHAQPAEPSTPASGVQVPPPQTEQQDSLKLVLEVLEEILEVHGGHPQNLGEGKIHSHLYMKCTINPYNAAREVTHFYAKALLKKLPPKWNPSPFWSWLAGVVDKPFEPTLLTIDQMEQVRRRKKLNKSSSKPKSDREDEIRGPRGAGKRWPPNTLTPRTGILAPSTGSKRPAVYYSDDDDDERAHKVARTSQDSGDDEDENEDVDDDTSDDDIPASTTLATPTPAPPLETARLVVHAERVPSMSPSGPNGTWRCEEDSCNYIVRSAEEPEGKDLIAKHFQEHASRAERLDLALSEGTRNHMPINHLLEKIRSMGEMAQIKEQNRAGEASAPMPVKRKLII
ncbi:hypothetical protein KVR01_006769 [Diaporthe batatas]|uniref:uncharacterized protein n=1 Tax=Diaporthe batatas TaxID=748121 RepID=UPI001D03BB18|nr:uncharacterized protein KVR01_006769 [Diaporthe batatas]KAG8163472.1 hypothetical protein KVR01_006769 [Diaporthe batatas]